MRAPLDPDVSVRCNAPAVGHELRLESGGGAIDARFSEMHRRNIRRAERDGVSTAFDQSLAGMREFYRLHVLTRQRQGVPVQPWHFFQLLWEQLISRDLGFVELAYRGPTCVAAAVFLAWNGTLVYKYGASDPRHWQVRPNNLLFWAAIRWASEHDFHTFDLGRTDFANQGLRDFKTGWGAVERALVYSSVGSDPRPGSRPIWQRVGGAALKTIIRHSPPPVCRLLGGLMYRYAA